MRGKADEQRALLTSLRITPAYAGKRAFPIDLVPANKDHPRLCGEKVITVLAFGLMIGSPPPMRGKVPKNVYRARSVRITPAYAGKSCHFRQGDFHSWDHPRLCGEKYFSRRCEIAHCGSPPPMRGKVISTRIASVKVRITPAYAGKRLVQYYRIRPR